MCLSSGLPSWRLLTRIALGLACGGRRAKSQRAAGRPPRAAQAEAASGQGGAFAGRRQSADLLYTSAKQPADQASGPKRTQQCTLACRQHTGRRRVRASGAGAGCARSARRPARPRRRAGAGRCPRPPALRQQTRPGPPAPPRRARRARAARRPRRCCRLHAGRPTSCCRRGRPRRTRPRGRCWRAPRRGRRARAGQRRCARPACEQRGGL